MNIRIPIFQAILLVLISILIGIGSNILSSKPLPWFAVELSVVEDVEIKSNEPILAAISIEQAKLFFDDEDNRLEMGVDFNSFDQGSYQEGEYTADEAMELYRKISEGVVKENQDHSDEEDLDLDPDYDKGGKYYSEEGAEAFRIQPLNKMILNTPKIRL